MYLSKTTDGERAGLTARRSEELAVQHPVRQPKVGDLYVAVSVQQQVLCQDQNQHHTNTEAKKSDHGKRVMRPIDDTVYQGEQDTPGRG